MTTSRLLLFILLGIGIQLACAAGIQFWRIRRSGRSLDVSDTPRPAPAGNWLSFRVVKREFEDDARTQCSFYLEPVDERSLPDFKPGQYLTFSLTIADPHNVGITKDVIRCYSLSDSSHPTHYRVTIKRACPPEDNPTVRSGVASSHFHDQVHAGSVVKLKPPSGHFYLDTASDLPVVLIAGGIGITPMMSMLQWLIRHQPARQVHLFYGIRNGYEHAFRKTLDSIARAHPKFHLHVAYSRPSSDDRFGTDYHFNGRIDAKLLREVLGSLDYQFYLCGPAALMNSLVPALLNCGVPEPRVHFEAFGPTTVGKTASSGKPDQGPSGNRLEIRFEKSGRTLEWSDSDSNLLEFAERHGIEINSGCRSGGCGCCEVGLTAGDIHYDRTPDHDIAPGNCLLCVAKPKSALILEA